MRGMRGTLTLRPIPQGGQRGRRRRRLHPLPPLRDRIGLALLGPTTVHLRHEVHHAVSMTLLAAAVLSARYRGSFGTVGDLRYLLLTLAVLGRHLLLRILGPCDTSTSARPTVLGAVAHVVLRCCSAGQYFDPPPPSALPAWNDGGGSGVGGLAGRGGGGGGRGATAVLLQAWGRRLGVDRTWPRLLRLLHRSWGGGGGGGTTTGSGGGPQRPRRRRGSGGRGAAVQPSSMMGGTGGGGGGGGASSSSSSRAATSLPSPGGELVRAAWGTLRRRSPPFQLAILLGTVAAILTSAVRHPVLGRYSTGPSRNALGGGGRPDADFPGGGERFHSEGLAPSTPLHVYLKQSRYKWGGSAGPGGGGDGSATAAAGGGGGGWPFDRSGVPGVRHWSGGPFGAGAPSALDVLLALGGLSTLLSFWGFRRMLFPLPDLAASLRAQGGGGGHHPRAGSKQSGRQRGAAAAAVAAAELPWAERSFSLTRFLKVHTFGVLVGMRVCENLLLCVLMPLSEFACFATGHCSASPAVYGLPGYTGVALGPGLDRPGGTPRTDYDSLPGISRSWIAALAVTVALATPFLLTAQMLLLDRSDISISGYTPEAGEGGSGGERSGGRRAWEAGPRNVVLGNAERWPKPFYEMAPLIMSLYNRFANGELGHPSTSLVTSMIGMVLFNAACVFLAAWYFQCAGPTPAWFAMLGTAVAAKGCITVGLENSNYYVYNDLADEIAAPLLKAGAEQLPEPKLEEWTIDVHATDWIYLLLVAVIGIHFAAGETILRVDSLA